MIEAVAGLSVLTLNAPPRLPGETLLTRNEHYIIDINIDYRVREA